MTFAIDLGNGGQPQLRSQLTLDRKTGEVVRWEPYSNNTLGRRLRTWMRFAHTGEVYGLAGQTVAALASLGGAFLVYTGLSLAWRRFCSWRGRRSIAVSFMGCSPFSLATITTTGYGDLAPVHQLARSLANMEAVFGQIFPVTFVARLVALHLAYGKEKKRDESGASTRGPQD